MENFLVLGNIPGTNIQIDFITWLNAMCVLFIIYLMRDTRPIVAIFRLFAAMCYVIGKAAVKIADFIITLVYAYVLPHVRAHYRQ